MKIAVVTIYDLNNFGNRLQNFALSYFLETNLNAYVCVPVYISKDEYKEKIRRNLRILKGNCGVGSSKLVEVNNSTVNHKKNPLDKAVKIAKKVNSKLAWMRIRSAKYKKFKDFTQNNINVLSYNPKSLSKVIDECDFFVVGSDQVWNPAGWAIGTKRNFDKYLLTRIPDEKRISYAASIGVDEMPQEIAGKFTDEIKKFKAVSVREQRGAEIIKEISGVDSEVLIDPTMLLTKEDWLKVAKRHPKRSSKPYAFKYFLGEQSDKRKAYIRKIAKKNGLGIYDLMNAKSKVYTSGPAEFIDLIANAEVVFTDSFHACVFSILMGRPFVVMNREQAGMDNMNSRIVTLLEKLGLEDRLPGKVAEDKIFECNYEKVYHNLEIEREKAKKFLEKSFKN